MCGEGGVCGEGGGKRSACGEGGVCGGGEECVQGRRR